MASTLTAPAGTPVWYPPRPPQNPACPADKHGTYTAYQRNHCRCPDAREAWRLYSKRRREGRLPQQFADATGTRRRLRALAAIGWSQAKLAELLGYRNDAAVGRLIRDDVTPRINVRTEQAVATLYDRLSMSPGPSDRSRRYAQQAGWAPPLAWDDNILDDPTAEPATDTDTGRDTSDGVDPIAVERACAGQLGENDQLTAEEQHQALQQLTDAGLSNAAIGTRLNLSARHVQRLKANSRQQLEQRAATSAAQLRANTALDQMTTRGQAEQEPATHQGSAPHEEEMTHEQ